MSARVLLVDDVPEIRRLVRTALRFRGGFEVVAEADDGARAIELAVASQPDIVVLDLGLPDLAGREVIGQLRSRVPHARIVVFTGTDAEGQDDIRRHVDGYLVKDSELDYLVDLLEALVDPVDRAATLDLGNDPRSPALARRFVESHCVQWRCSDVVDSASLVVSELVTNAVTHASSGCELRLSLGTSSFRIEVADRGTGSPDPRDVAEDDEHGRGLFLVSAVATAWGVESAVPSGKVIWAELALPGD